MAGKKIAFTGAPSTGKSILQMKTFDLLDGEEKTKISNNISLRMLDMINEKYAEYFDESQEILFSTAFARRVEMFSVNPDFYIVSDEWVLNELAKTMVKMKHLQDKINHSNQILGADGKPVFTSDHGDLVIIQAAFQILVNQVALEKEFWDFLYYVPIYDPGDDILDEDGIKPKEKLHQKEVDLAITSLIQQLQLNVVNLPVDMEDAFKVLEAEKRKWTE
jgi:hypothetical protein